ncbi:efflux RND transporter permease subunit [Zwartia sp.]|uniref:efflux RND transporter permease subunit n=1 Tax=Zwartia sp. TaxID=2978004 RepID=UPI0027174424|nr:efflux RND transporter permease subunit [Zwartia sp.]MDO9026105.1 efflux RND transporter permease subunit [Zwartia sp.]
MNFSALSIRHPIPAILLFVLLSIAGILSFRAIGVQDFPDIELPMVTVEASLPGAAPATLETEVARKLENSIATLQGIKNLYTKILEGAVVINVEFVLEKNPMEAVNDVRDAVTRVRADLPADVREPTILRATTAGRPLMTYALTSSRMDQEALSWFVDNTVAKQLLTVNGVGRVKRMGGLNREVQVELDPLRMAALGVTAADVSRRLRLIQQEAPGGRGDIGGAEQAVRTIATAETAADLGKIDLSLNDGRRVRLDQIATISDTTAERRSTALVNGQPVVAFEIMRSKGANEVTVARDVRQVIDGLMAANRDIQFTEQIDNVAATEENFDGSMKLLYEGAILAVLVVWYFLRDWRATIISAAALPLSILPAFLGMYLFGFTLNMVTLTSLALVVGILVDDAIVEVENIERHLRMGKTPFQAAMDAADEIGMAVIATTFALVAVFLPTAFMDGIPGKFFKQFGWTAVLAIMASLVVARLLTPMMAAYLMKPISGPHAEPKPDSWVMRQYLRIMGWCLNHRLVTIVFAFAFFAGSLALVPLLPKGFVPPADRGQTLVNIERAPGSTLEDTMRAAERARLKLASIPEVRSIFSTVGAGVSGDVFARGSAAEVRKATLTLTLTHRSDRDKTQQDVEADIRRVLSDEPGVRVTVGAQDVGVKMQIVLQSEDPIALSKAAQAAERDLRTLKGVGGVTSSASLVRPELIVRPNFARAADLGVTSQSIAETLRVATSGDYDVGLAKLNLTERQIPIRVKLPDATRTDIAALERLTVPGRYGPTLLGNVVTFTMDSGPAQIDRLNRSRNVILDVELGGRPLGEVFAEAMALPSLNSLPAGVTLAELGDTKEMQALFASFGLAMAIGLLCIYMILVLLFHDFLQPITILGALPLSIGGAFVALLLTGKSFSMPSLIGLLMLMGVVTKNSILLVEYAITARRKGMLRNDALVDACHKRARPIVMTTIAMTAGMIPIAIGWGSDPSFRSPMAIAVIGGLMTSTLLSLLVIPAVFTYIDDFDQWLGRMRKRLGGHKPAVAQPHSQPD